MSYIAPNTTIKLLTNCPLDNTYDHTIYFESKTSQTNYFNTLVKYTFNQQSYQRVERGKIRVQVLADDIYDCNYVMFQNSSFGNKWFYAFITGIEYINNVVSEITFEIDAMQTWFFDYDIEYCFVEREHAVTDTIGQHIEPENIELGEYVFNNYDNLSLVLQPLAVFIMIVDEDEEADGTLYDGVYGGCTLFAYNRNDVENIKLKINSYLQKPDAILAMYMAPVIGTGMAIPEGGTQILYSESSQTITGTADAVSTDDTIDGYKPKNNKLYTYPYNFFHIDNSSGSELTLRYEFFTSLTPTWEVSVPITMPIQCILRPTNYKGSGDDTMNAETLTLSNYPMCSWSTDAFKAWLAQNAIPIAASISSGFISSAITGNPIGVLHSVSQIPNSLTAGYKASISADISKGNLNNGNGNVSANKQCFYGGRCSITAEYARIIDEYFTMFGYATKRCKIPNRNSRPHWNYVKTLGCTITGSVPADDANKICSIYNNGVTFWKNGNEVGNYSLDNTV